MNNGATTPMDELTYDETEHDENGGVHKSCREQRIRERVHSRV